MARKQTLGLRDLRRIPGVGADMAQHLREIGIGTIDDLVGQDAEALYARACQARGAALDRCVLYVFREAVYFAEHAAPDPEKLRWWYWKDP